jgi:hypothetical protein
MIGFRLQLKKLSDGRLVLTIPIGYKILLLVIGLLILVSLIVTRDEGGGSIFIRENTIPLIICFISLMGAAYHERWIFDKDQSRIIHQNGLVALHSNKLFRIEDFEQIEVSTRLSGAQAESGKTERRLVRRLGLNLILKDRDGRNYRLETYRASQKEKVGRIAREIAEYCGLAFSDQSTVQ